jgi:hypothetical protein
MHLQFEFAVGHLHAQRVARAQALVVHIAHEAARAVAALLHLAAVGVVDHVFEVQPGPGRRPHAQDLVGAHAEMAIGQEAVLGRAQAQAAPRLVEHDEVVARALHLGEADVHGADYPSTPVRTALALGRRLVRQPGRRRMVRTNRVRFCMQSAGNCVQRRKKQLARLMQIAVA